MCLSRVHPVDEMTTAPAPEWQALRTLLLLVLFLVAGLALYATPGYLRARSRGQLVACKSNLKNLATALETWSEKHQGSYPDCLRTLVDDGYLRARPTCPGAGRDTYVYTARARGFWFYCSGNHHDRSYLAYPVPHDNYPQYDAVTGLADHP